MKIYNFSSFGTLVLKRITGHQGIYKYTTKEDRKRGKQDLGKYENIPTKDFSAIEERLFKEEVTEN